MSTLPAFSSSFGWCWPLVRKQIEPPSRYFYFRLRRVPHSRPSYMIQCLF
ncbi:mCG148337 [Mus musculus]|nr:mCG148337 [Mus musculus]